MLQQQRQLKNDEKAVNDWENWRDTKPSGGGDAIKDTF